MKSRVRNAVAVCALAGALLAGAGTARAQVTPPAPAPVGRFTGIIGMTMLGFEAVFDVELAVGLRNAPILVISSIVGAAGAGIGGYFTEKELTRVRVAGGLAGPGPVAVIFLCVGMAGVVPTVIAFKNTNFHRAKDTKGAAVVETTKGDSGATPEPAPEPAPGAPGAPAPGTGGLVSVTPGGVFVGAPAVEWGPALGAFESAALGAAGPRLAATLDETRFTVVRIDF